MMELFSGVDDIVRLGKWAYNQIPLGERCKGCPLLGNAAYNYDNSWYCNLRRGVGLLRSEGVPYKDDSCPGKGK